MFIEISRLVQVEEFHFKPVQNMEKKNIELWIYFARFLLVTKFQQILMS